MSPARLALASFEAGSPAFSSILERVHQIGREVIAGAADAVDRDARFPTEAFEAL